MGDALKPRAILFDFYNTLGVSDDWSAVSEVAVLAEFGYTVEAAAFRGARDALQQQLDSAAWLDHREHSASRGHYNELQRTLIAPLLRDLGVDPQHPGCFERLCDVWDDPARIRLFDDSLPALERLRRAGFRLGVVSNWSWSLHDVLELTGVAALIECAVISAQAGYRKPHPATYAQALAAVAAPAHEVWFVGDDPRCDVHGPLAAGMTPLHIDRFEAHAPAPAVRRLRDLRELADLLDA